MEPLIASANAQHSLTSAEQSTETVGAQQSDGQSQTEESFEATIVRLDQTAAESLFRKAGL